jgi:hypothetical protein
MRWTLPIVFTVVAVAACSKPTEPAAPAPAAAVAAAQGAVSQAAAAFKVDGEGFIHNWLVLDPIGLTDDSEHSEEVEKPMFAKEYFADQLAARPKANDKVKVGNTELVWREVKLDASTSQIDVVQFCEEHGTSADQALFWAVAYVVAPEEMKGVKLAIGSDDSCVWWVNGKEQIRAYESRGVNADDNVSDPITLQKGLNVVRFAVINGDGPGGACARFLDAKDAPVTNLQVAGNP